MTLHLRAAILAAAAISTVVSGCASRRPPTATPTAPAPEEPAPAAPVPAVPDRKPPGTDTEVALGSEVGLASYYGRQFQGQTTASGKRFDMRELVAAHPSYAFGTRVRVTNLANDRQVVVTIIDRGPTERYQSDGVIIDLSQEAAKALGFIRDGRQRVRVEVLEWGPEQTPSKRKPGPHAALPGPSPYLLRFWQALAEATPHPTWPSSWEVRAREPCTAIAAWHATAPAPSGP